MSPSPDQPVVITITTQEIDAATAADFAAELAAADGSHRAVAIDLGAVTFLDSRGVAVLVDTCRRLRSAGTTIELRNPTTAVRRVLDITGVWSLAHDEWA